MAVYEETEIIRWENGKAERLTDDVVVESSLELVVNDRSVVTLLCSPEKREALAVGYLRSEGLIEGKESIKNVNLVPEDKSIELELTEDFGGLEAYFDRKRALTSSCGRASTIIEKLEELKLEKPERPVGPGLTQMSELMKDLQKKAGLFRRTGGSHTAALAKPDGIEYLAEDIGRHNAVDKVIGGAVLSGCEPGSLTLLTSGRLSSEMVLKAIRSSIPIVISRSAPTTLAVRMGRLTDLTMVGFVRGSRLSIYSGEERVRELGLD